VGHEIEDQIAGWIERAVIGLDLCPFASSVWKSGRVRIAVSEARTAEDAVRDLMAEAAQLLDADPSRLSTTLVVFAHALADFDDYLDAVADAEHALAEAGAEGVLQIATFHPEYRFAGADPDALSNYTNRSPHPVMHLLREAEVSDAVDAHPDPESIPARNIERIERLGRAAIEALLKG
jgi:uncharacterized protein